MFIPLANKPLGIDSPLVKSATTATMEIKNGTPESCTLLIRPQKIDIEMGVFFKGLVTSQNLPEEKVQKELKSATTSLGLLTEGEEITCHLKSSEMGLLLSKWTAGESILKVITTNRCSFAK